MKPLRFQDERNIVAYAFVVAEEEDTHEPLTYHEAVACEDSSKRKDVMKDEMDSLRKNKTWELVDHLAGQKLVSCKWLFKIKKGLQVFKILVQHTSIQVIPVLIACKDYELEQLDVKTTFLHENLKEVIYMRSYGLGKYIYLLLYVDDMLIDCKSKAEIGSTKYLLKKEFDMKDLKKAKKILGMEIVRDRSRKILKVSQFRYVFKILNNFRIDNEKSVKIPLGEHFKLSLKDCSVRDYVVERMSKVPYANAVGSLMYLMVCTRPDITYADLDKGRFITRYAFLVHGCVVSWMATLQHVVALSTTEAEYMALTEAVNEAIWLRGLLEALDVELNTVAVNYDNQGTIHLSWNHVFHEKSKHINVLYHFIREVLEANMIKVLNDEHVLFQPAFKPTMKSNLDIQKGGSDVRFKGVMLDRANEAHMWWPDSSDDQRLLLVVQYAHGNQYFGKKMIRSPRRMNLAGVHQLIRRRLNVATRCGHGTVNQIHVEIRGKRYVPVVNNAQWRESGLSKTFWAETTCMAAYLINWSPSRAIEKKTPTEMWSGHPTDYGMFRIFGCVVYSHNKQGKLEPKAVEVELQRLNNHTLEKDQIDQEDVVDEDAGDQSTDQPPDLTDYQLVWDREPRIRTKPLRFGDESNMAAYAFIAAKKEMDSLRKNK
nr:hypothetical protein [Tanacetum cinerariifolium]